MHEHDHEHHHHDHEDHHDHGHHHHHEHGEYQDAHARAHANDIKRRFDGREVTNWQILLFGLTGGLIPCPAAITVLLICIQLKALTLGATLVVSFSLGLALTLVTVGVMQQSAFSRSQNAGADLTLSLNALPIFPVC